MPKLPHPLAWQSPSLDRNGVRLLGFACRCFTIAPLSTAIVGFFRQPPDFEVTRRWSRRPRPAVHRPAVPPGAALANLSRGLALALVIYLRCEPCFEAGPCCYRAGGGFLSHRQRQGHNLVTHVAEADSPDRDR